MTSQNPGLPMFTTDSPLLRPRVAILSDIGNEPDDQMSMVRLLLYSNELDLVALVATTSTWQRTAVHPETIQTLIHVYGEVRPNLLKHAKDWPTESTLASRVTSGQASYGMAATGDGKSTPGSDRLLKEMLAADARPLWICVWGGANTLAQALIDLRSSVDASTQATVLRRLRVYSISDQDDAGPWIRREFPELQYIVTPSLPTSDSYYAATWTGISGDAYYRNGEGADASLVTNAWLDRNVRSKGPLGQAYPAFLYIMEGDTPSFLNLIRNGLNAAARPDWGGWGGRYALLQPYGESRPIWTQGGDEFRRATTQDAVTGVDGLTHVSDQATIWRWREAYQNDFAARMDWTIHDFKHSNHAPSVVVDGREGSAPLYKTLKVGKTVKVSASGTTDPDGNKLMYHWFLYPEAGLTGTHGAIVNLSGEDRSEVTITGVSNCSKNWIETSDTTCHGDGIEHVILAVTDDGSPRLTSYRRVIVRVTP